MWPEPEVEKKLAHALGLPYPLQEMNDELVFTYTFEEDGIYYPITHKMLVESIDRDFVSEAYSQGDLLEFYDGYSIEVITNQKEI